jgi:glycosyltransferase involved in cell wall biosynthesis
MRPLRVLQVIDGLTIGGAESVVLAMLELADRRRVEMYLANVGGEYDDELLERALAAGARWTLPRGRALWDLRSLVSLVRTILRHDIDLVHTHLAGADVLGGLAGKLTRRPVVTTLHSVAAFRETYRRERRALSDFAVRRLADRVVAVSTAVRDSYVEALGIRAGRFVVLPNVPLAELLLPAGFDRERKRQSLGVADRAVVVTASGLKPFRDHATLLRAVPAVAARRPDLSVLIVGEGPEEASLRALARELGVEAQVTFLGPRFDAVEIVAAADVFCQPTLMEGLSISVLDAMSLGRPVVASSVEGTREIVDDGVSGLLVPPRDADALAAAINHVLGDDARAAALGAALQNLGGAISTDEMRRLNYEVDANKRAPADVARAWRGRKGL